MSIRFLKIIIQIISIIYLSGCIYYAVFDKEISIEKLPESVSQTFIETSNVSL